MRVLAIECPPADEAILEGGGVGVACDDRGEGGRVRQDEEKSEQQRKNLSIMKTTPRHYIRSRHTPFKAAPEHRFA
jgi:hypothetical protein